MPRVCFTLQVRPERLADYRAAHAAVWPEMLHALRDAGWRDYQLFLRPDGLLVGTADVEDLGAAQAAVGATEVSTRWEAAMAGLFVPGTGDGTDKAPLELVFDLDHQLDALLDHRARALQVLREQRIETPSWGYGNSGTRFKVFAQPGVPRTPEEKIDDAATVHRFTGVAPLVSLHIPWDRVEDYAALSAHAQERGVQLGAINANVFQDDDYRLGSVCNPDPAVRRKATDHLLECIDIMDATGSDDLKLWFADGTNYPGQDSIRDRQDRLAEALAETYARLRGEQRLLLEYKFFEPAFYTTDVPDWGTSFAHCLELGPQAQVVLDTGHHAPGTNIEFIVATLLRHGRLGAFDFNSRFYADDDLMAGAADPFQLFRIMHELVQADAVSGVPATGSTTGQPISFFLDQCHNIEPKVAAMIRSVTNVQEATAKALLVDTEALTAAQRSGDVLAAYSVVKDAYDTDVRPLLGELRESLGLDPDPSAAYARSGYFEQVAAERVGGEQAGWGA